MQSFTLPRQVAVRFADTGDTAEVLRASLEALPAGLGARWLPGWGSSSSSSPGSSSSQSSSFSQSSSSGPQAAASDQLPPLQVMNVNKIHCMVLEKRWKNFAQMKQFKRILNIAIQ